MGFPPLSEALASLVLLGGSAVASYAAARAAGDALLTLDNPAPARRAAIHSATTAIIALAAIFHRPAMLDVAAGVPFAATIAATTLALGVVFFVAPLQKPTSRPALHRSWGFLLPTGLLTLFIGFSGELTPRSALILAAEGGAILVVCLGPSSSEKFTAKSHDGSRVQDRSIPLAATQAILALGLAIIAAWGMMHGAAGLALHSPIFRPGVAAAAVLGPAIVLPMIPPIATLAEVGKRDEATTTLVAFALLNLCLVLPLVILVQHFLQKTTAATQPADPGGIPFPILVWRLDTVLIATVGLLLLPTATGRWTLARAEGLALIGGFVIYLFLTLLISHN